MCKIVELRWSKDEIKSYIRCNYDMLLILAKEKQFKIPLNDHRNVPIEKKAEKIMTYMLERTRSHKVVKDALHYYAKICEFTALLKLELYND